MRKLLIICSPFIDAKDVAHSVAHMALDTDLNISVVGSIEHGLMTDINVLDFKIEDWAGVAAAAADVNNDILVATHLRSDLTDRVSELMLTLEESEISRLSSTAWKHASLENLMLREETRAKIHTSVCKLDSSLLDDPNVSGWIEYEHRTRAAKTKVEIEEMEEVQPVLIEEVEAEAVVEQQEAESTDHAVDETAPQSSPELHHAVLAEEVSDTSSETEDAVESEREREPIPVIPMVSAFSQSETASDPDEFDPLELAFNDSLELADSPVAKDEVINNNSDVTEQLSSGVVPKRPEVNSKVEILKDPLSPSDKTNPEAFYDWGGSVNNFNSEYERIDTQFENAQSRRVNANLTDYDLATVNAATDRVTNNVSHDRQYVEGSEWSQVVRTPTVNMPFISPIKNPNYGDQKYVGEDSVSLIKNRMRIGVTVGVFLPHTGIYFLLVSPQDGQLLDTLSLINTQRIETLRASSGILLGNSNYYINKQVLNLFLDNITSCSLASFNKEILEELIDERDIDIIATALQASIYPDGYEYIQVCGLRKDNGEMCDNQQRFLVDLKRMIFVDNSRLSEAQRSFAVGGLKQRSLADIKNYQEQNYLGFKKGYEITEGIQFVYKAQSIKTSIEAGETWIGEISKVVDQLIAFNNDEKERNMMINQRIDLTRIREFSHWVDEILIDDQPLTDKDKIVELLNNLSRNREVIEKVGETLSEFQRLAVVGIVGIPRVKCTSCQKTDPRDLDISPHLIPQDAVSRFFTLANQHL